MHGAGILYTVVREWKVPGYTSAGWTNATRILSLRAAPWRQRTLLPTG